MPKLWWRSRNFSVPVVVKAVEQNARILVEWSAYRAPTPIKWIFAPRPDDTTFVSVTNKGFPGTEAEAVQHALDATEGFAFVMRENHFAQVAHSAPTALSLYEDLHSNLVFMDVKMPKGDGFALLPKRTVSRQRVRRTFMQVFLNEHGLESSSVLCHETFDSRKHAANGRTSTPQRQRFFESFDLDRLGPKPET